MEHVVFFPAHDGTPAFRRVGALQEAVRLVEHLRNVEGVSEVSVHALSEVPLAFKPWYRVELPDDAESAPDAPAEAPVEHIGLMPEAAPPAVAVVPEQAEAPVEAPAEEAAEAPAEAPADLTADESAPDADTKEAGAASLGFFAS